jgi:hypothetical protein
MNITKRPNKMRVCVSLSAENREAVRLLSKATERPESRIVDAALRMWRANLTPAEREAIERQRAAEAAPVQG